MTGDAEVLHRFSEELGLVGGVGGVTERAFAGGGRSVTVPVGDEALVVAAEAEVLLVAADRQQLRIVAAVRIVAVATGAFGHWPVDRGPSKRLVALEAERGFLGRAHRLAVVWMVGGQGMAVGASFVPRRMGERRSRRLLVAVAAAIGRGGGQGGGKEDRGEQQADAHGHVPAAEGVFAVQRHESR